MGNCCGGESPKGFEGEGRTLGAQPATAPSQTGNARASAPPKISGPGRTLGKESDGASDAGAAAARAAEERRKASTQGKGKLGRQLDAERGQNQNSTLAQTARENVAARDADAATQVRNYN
ncbi:hypothetical protein LTR62_000481 [Meristemomyces frigidus]|uniref:Uncharacterized protein n=1 Tax=Meristemomyces frigidus TaxID=1508187 RepID=A0AAN7TU60_9PEZI|nr:hypothetical protein LTR62_000481 [Meristemomyces frigidus]